jgi:hypothetical protein
MADERRKELVYYMMLVQVRWPLWTLQISYLLQLARACVCLLAKSLVAVPITPVNPMVCSRMSCAVE